MKKTAILLLATMAVTAMNSCEKEEKEETKISSNSSSESHYVGKDCMECHISGGEGEGWFIAAGTVYDSTKSTINAGGTIKLYSGPNGTGSLVKTIEVDQKGNFYTTEDISFSGGIYPAVSGSSSVLYMAGAVSNGKCNSCHGVSTDRIWIE